MCPTITDDGATAAGRAKSFDLRGKDYFTRAEAAHYACISLRQFDTVRQSRGIPAIPWAGKVVFRKDDIRRVIESQAIESPAKRRDRR